MSEERKWPITKDQPISMATARVAHGFFETMRTLEADGGEVCFLRPFEPALSALSKWGWIEAVDGRGWVALPPRPEWTSGVEP